jgi:hypothetical protein
MRCDAGDGDPRSCRRRALADRAILLSGSPARINDDVALGHDGEHQLRMRFADLRNAA